jgi:predicted nucleic acid-binding protein
MRRTCVLDTSLLLALSTTGQLHIFLSNSRYEWVITPLVRGELIRRESRDVVDRAISGGDVKLAEIDTTSERELRIWSKWSSLVDPGEAEAIALAQTRGWLVGLEDRQAQRALDRDVGRGHWINGVNVLLNAIEDGVLSAPDAELLFQKLDSYPGYVKRGATTLSAVRVR